MNVLILNGKTAEALIAAQDGPLEEIAGLMPVSEADE